MRALGCVRGQSGHSSRRCRAPVPALASPLIQPWPCRRCCAQAVPQQALPAEEEEDLSERLAAIKSG